MQIKPQKPVVVVVVVVACTIGQGSVHTNAFSLVCVFVVIENAPTDSRVHTTVLMLFGLSTIKRSKTIEVQAVT